MVMHMTAKLQSVLEGLGQGGYVQFTWSNCAVVLIVGESKQAVDGRTYQAFCSCHAGRFQRVETGKVGDDLSKLVITWRK